MADASEEFRHLFITALDEESDVELAGETGDGEEAVRLARELAPDVVVMDFVLTRMDGLEVLEALAALPARPRVLVLSSFARGNMAELAASHGADYYMLKPCKLSTVLERVRQLTAQDTENGETGRQNADGSWSPVTEGITFTNRYLPAFRVQYSPVVYKTFTDNSKARPKDQSFTFTLTPAENYGEAVIR